MKIRKKFLLALTLLSVCTGTALFIAASPGLLISDYIYPTLNGRNPGHQLETAASRVQSTAIINSNNESLDSVDSNDSVVIDHLRSAGGKTFGYVQSNSTDYKEQVTNQNGNAIVEGFDFDMDELNLDQYLTFNHADKFFINDMPAFESKVSEYKDIYHSIKPKNSRLQAIGYAGTSGIEDAVKLQPKGITVNLEDFRSNDGSTSLLPWDNNFGPSNDANLPHGIEPIPDTQIIVVDLTKPSADTPLAVSPSYWNQQISILPAISDIPEPTTWSMIILGLMMLFLIRLRKCYLLS
jgi:hypothetical protein